MEYREILNDPNICIYNNNIVIESNTISLLMNENYVNNMFMNIVNNIDLINRTLNTNNFSLKIDGYTIDGLYETNSLLIHRSSKIYPYF